MKIVSFKKNYGFAKGNNKGVEYANWEYIAFLNNDTEVTNDWLMKLMTASIEHTVGVRGVRFLVVVCLMKRGVDWLGGFGFWLILVCGSWGLNVLEAGALGVPCVGYDVAGLRDSVRDGETGLLVRSGDVLGLADVSPGSPDTDMLTHNIYRMIIANQTQNLAFLLVFLNVKFIMIHGDYKWSALEWNQPISYLFDVLEKRRI